MSETSKPKGGNLPKSPGKAPDSGQARAGRADLDEADSLMGLGNTGVLRRLIEDDSLALADDKPGENPTRSASNPAAKTTGFDPYGGALDPPEHKKKRTDLRALSAWIEKKRKMEQGGGE